MHKLLQQIRDNKELFDLEDVGFHRGDEKGKSMNVYSQELATALYKQIEDFKKSYSHFSFMKEVGYEKFARLDVVKQDLANLRNNAGCLFLKLVEEESKRE